jgi:hypothetical protein
MEEGHCDYFYLYWKLKAFELLEEVEPLVIAIANAEAQIASAEDMRYD